MLAVFAVNITADAVDATPLGDGAVDVDLMTAGDQITLRAAIMEANTLVGDDTITLPAGTYMLSIPGANENAAATGDLDITDATGELTVIGTGASSTIIDAAGLDRVFDIQPNTSFDNASPSIALHLSDVTITGGSVTGMGGGILNAFATLTIADSVITDNNANDVGGGIAEVVGATTISNSILSDNHSSSGGGIGHFGGLLTVQRSSITGNSCNQFGGGLFIRTASFGLDGASVVNIIDTTISNNDAASAAGGGIANFGSTSEGGTITTIINSTISGNSATGAGGIFHSSQAEMVLLNSTVTQNSALRAGGILSNPFGTPPGGTLTTKNTIVADNFAPSDPDVRGPFISQGNNLIGTVGAASGFVVGDLQNISPLLGPLQNNGGPTSTHALLVGSPAIHAGTSIGAPPTDQRGVSRPQGAGIDIGAFEEVVVTNEPPSADAGTPYEIYEGDPLALDATDSFDPDGDPLTYAWDLNGDGQFTDATGATPVVTWADLISLGIDDDGTFSVSVRVDDGQGETDDASQMLSVLNAAPSAILSGSSGVSYGGSVTVDFSGQFDPSPADTAVGFRYAYSLDAASLASASYANGTTSDSWDFGTLDAGAYTVFARIIDKDDGYSQYQLEVTVDPAPLTVTVDDATWEIGTPFPEFTATYSGFVLGQDESVLGGTLAFNTAASSTSKVSTYAVAASGLTSSNYQINFVDGTLTVTPAEVAIEFGQTNLNIEKNGALSLVILGSSTFDVSQVSIGSLSFADAAIDVFNHTFVDMDRDGRVDLNIHFQMSEALKTALTDLYADLLQADFETDAEYSRKQEQLIALDGAFGEFGQEFHGSASSTLFLAGNALETLLAALGI
jgi:hypothetical protein